MSCSSHRKKVLHDELIVGKMYRIVNQWYAYNYMNDCMEIFTGEYIRKNQINNNTHIVFLVNGREKYVSSVNDFYLVEDDSNIQR
jgi:hypothetical protein